MKTKFKKQITNLRGKQTCKLVKSRNDMKLSSAYRLCIWFIYFMIVSSRERPGAIRAKLHEMTVTGRMNDIISYLEAVERSYGTLLIDETIPSLYSYKGVALYNGLRVKEAEDAFQVAVQHFPNDTRSWINLGELQVQTFKLTEAFNSFNAALQAGDMAGLPRAIRAKGWSASWEYFEALTSTMERETKLCVDSLQDCRIDSSGGMEYTDVDERAHVLMNSLNPNSQLAPVQVPVHSVAPLWRMDPAPAIEPSKSIFQFSLPPRKAPAAVSGSAHAETRRLKVGFMSADFGIHPVAQLVRGLFQYINTSRMEVYCFSLQPKVSWWGQNISDTVEHFVWLQGMNTLDAAKEVARLGVEVLIDLNGHTMHSGLTIMAHQPAPLQMSYLGLPTTTAAPFIDYYIADSVAVPPEQQHHYSEQLALMSDCYIANDYAQIQGDVLKFSGAHRAPRSALNSPVDLSAASFLFATLSNSQKMDPAIFQVWMNILRRFPGSHMVLVEHAGSSVYIPNLQQNGRSFGIDPQRLVGLPQAPWIDHLYGKTSFDLMLDTVTKNGHTTGLDGVWAGVPTLSLAGGKEAPARAAESIAVSLESTLGLAYSLKEYEDMAFALARRIRNSRRAQDAASTAAGSHVDDAPDNTAAASDQDVLEGPGERRLRLWRQQVGQQRTQSNLFDVPLYEQQFTRLLQGTWELAHVARSKTAFQLPSASRGLTTSTHKKKPHIRGTFNTKKLFHIFTPVSGRHQSRDDLLGELGEEERAVRAVAQRLTNRDEHGRLRVHQSQSEGSVTNAAVRELERARDATAPDQPARDARNADGRTTRASAQPAEDGGGAEVGAYHQTGKGATGALAGEGKQRGTKYPAIPRFVFDGRLIMLNIGKCCTLDCACHCVAFLI
jgi:predicted O-linked N-acetylglucosamine transferase (SPINDLY family)